MAFAAERSWTIVFVAIAALSCCSHVSAQTQYFETLEYRSPSQCTRCQCLNVRSRNCREHRKGFYLREKGCLNGMLCTNCQYANGSAPTTCKCENPPYSVQASYGQSCTMGMDCAEGEGICFRPCETYLHVTTCPSLYCQWNTDSASCGEKIAGHAIMDWTQTALGASVTQQAEEIVKGTKKELFPMGFHDFWKGAQGYRIRGRLLQNITQPESLFLQLDLNVDGSLTVEEFSHLQKVLAELDQAVLLDDAKKAAEQRRLQSSLAVSPEVCNARKPRQYFCSFDVSCKLDCKECGWKSATDRAFSICVQPSRDVCSADGGKVYCQTDEMCHPPGDCSNCIDRPVVDHAQKACLALWWDPKPLTQWVHWVCRYRNKVGMPCRNDQDCIYGMRRCLAQQCMPYQPYNANQTCVNDFDCPHLGFYCPSDPTGGQNPYWVQYCRAQRAEGMTCSEDRECQPDSRCNTAEPQPRCRQLFSLPIGTPADNDELCQFGWRDLSRKCAPSAKSKQVSRPCDADADCSTTDETGRTGICACKAWWDKDDPKYCMPVAGDYENHMQSTRNYLWFKAKKCGSFWTEDECLRIFGNQAKRLKLAIECETQQLSKGPYLPPPDCGIEDDERFGDACALEAKAGR
eukprot:TRINITY_DN5275_c2_g1_i1.p1 TRINITY_DN5275_c2_g1~~TRINITY_DN5275_c2_g1_i1.p1  ORF type:complete len:661 (-),score=93.27 TRINITY_DN5275_c2_g1_i1:162-2054(-)